MKEKTIKKNIVQNNVKCNDGNKKVRLIIYYKIKKKTSSLIIKNNGSPPPPTMQRTNVIY